MLLHELIESEPSGSPRAWLLEALLRERPDLVDKEACWFKGGTMSHVVRVGGEVFKGPKEPLWDDIVRGHVIEGHDLRIEIERLSRLQHSPHVPKITYIGQTDLFYGMEWRRAPTLGAVFSRMSSKQKWKAAEKLGRFMAEMAKEFSDAKPEQTSRPFTDEEIGCFLQETLASDQLRNGLGTDYPFVVNVMTNYLQRSAKKKIVFHDDLHHNNILSDGKDSDVFAVIDFGVIKACLPENSLGRVLPSFGEHFAKRVWRHYAREDKDVDARDYYCRRLCDAISRWLLSNIHGDKKKIKCLIRSLKAIEKLEAKSSTQSPAVPAPSGTRSPS